MGTIQLTQKDFLVSTFQACQLMTSACENIEYALNSVVKILKSFLNILDKNHFDGMCIYYEFWQIISWLIRGLVKPQTYLVYITLFKRSMSW